MVRVREGAATDEPDSVTVPMTDSAGAGRAAVREAWMARRTAAYRAC